MAQRDFAGASQQYAMIKLGILGGGQLAQMTLQAGISLGISTVIFERLPDSPASRYTPFNVVGEWDDAGCLRDFASLCDIVTLENEFVEVEALRQLEAWGLPVYPSAATIALIQDKLIQKETFQRAGLPLPPFQSVHTPNEILQFAEQYPVVLKARRNGYDGYGNATLRSPDDLVPAWEKLSKGGRELLVETFVPFECELAVMVVRSRGGEIRAYPVVETVQENHICHIVRAPAAIPSQIAQRATEIAVQAVEAVQGVGVFGLEMFLMPDGELLLNEIAPRPHNSGHYTIEACETSQFENHIRAVMDWPLGSTALRSPAAVMVNLLGERSGEVDPAGAKGALGIDGACLHFYGKAEVRPGRKMGHITVLADSVEAAEERALQAAALVRF
jgi:5-(carboxyamino)imidazole ribonucleotide synthase